MKIRELALGDKEPFLNLLSHLNNVGDYYSDECLWFEVYKKQKESNTICFVVEINKEIVATGSIHWQQRFLHSGGISGQIEDVVVLPDYRGRGVFKKLMSFLEKELFENIGCYKISVHCDVEIKNIYKHLGYKNEDVLVVKRAP
jgi:GNAT superfamily N-acetyltransferase